MVAQQIESSRMCAQYNVSVCVHCTVHTHIRRTVFDSVIRLVDAISSLPLLQVLSMPLVIIRHVTTFHNSIHKCSKNTLNHKNVIEYIFHIWSRLGWRSDGGGGGGSGYSSSDTTTANKWLMNMTV